MITPRIRYYARLVYDINSKKTPKYVVTAQAGYYPAMDALRGRNGLVSFYLMEKLTDDPKAPAMRLQGKDSLNFTGLKDYFIDGKLSGFAYGNPLEEATYSRAKKPNPFFEYKGDGFLFIIHQNGDAATPPEQIRPTTIELIVVDGGKVLIPSYCKMLMMGGFDETLKQLRRQAANM